MILRGIILKTIKFKETSKIVYVLSNQGRVNGIYQGAYRKSTSINISSVSNIIEFRKIGKSDLPIFSHVNLISPVLSYKSSFELQVYVNHIIELIYNTYVDDLHIEKFYPFVETLLTSINDSNFILYTTIFQVKFMYILGILPDIKVCSKCGNQDDIAHISKLGDVFCKDCTSEKDNVNLFSTLYNSDINNSNSINVPKEQILSMFKFINEFYQYHLNYFSKSLDVLSKLDIK